MQAAFLIQSDSLRWVHLDQAGLSLQTGKIDFPESRLLVDNIHDAVDLYPELRMPFDQLQIIWVSPYFNLMPSGQRFREMAMESANLLLPTFSNLQTNDEDIRETDLLNVYKIDQYAANWLSQRYPTARQSHLLSLLLPIFLKHLDGNREPQIYLHIQENRLLVFGFKYGSLRLAVSYPVSSPKDLLYFALLALKQMGTEQEETRLNLTGMIEEASLYWNTLGVYFPDMLILKDVFSDFEDKIPQSQYVHYHLDLYAGLI
ncbi:MAG: DUF3822 family protein [Saprospiraceae bacterium]